MADKKKIGQLLLGYLLGSLTDEEEAILMDWVNQDSANRYIFDELLNDGNFSEILKDHHPNHKLALEKEIWHKITDRLSIVTPPKASNRTLKLIGIAASLVLIISIGGYFLAQFIKHRNNLATVAKADVKAPEMTKATVTLANGKRVLLDSVLSGTIAVQGDKKLIKTANGQLSYQDNSLGSNGNNDILYNIIENPKGSKVVDIVLSDKTHVWLNAGSSMKFPVPFAANQRKVVVTGEAYFNVSHNITRPFIVETQKINVEVLGTSFNVNAYTNQNNVKVTLLQGSVKLNNQTSNEFLKPGQQAEVSDKIVVQNNANLDAVMAWKNNRFVFDSYDIQQIMHQIEAWYDVEVIYQSTPTKEEFVGSISRDVNLSQILRLLAETKAVKFEIKGNRVFVK